MAELSHRRHSGQLRRGTPSTSRTHSRRARIRATLAVTAGLAEVSDAGRVLIGTTPAEHDASDVLTPSGGTAVAEHQTPKAGGRSMETTPEQIDARVSAAHEAYEAALDVPPSVRARVVGGGGRPARRPRRRAGGPRGRRDAPDAAAARRRADRGRPSRRACSRRRSSRASTSTPRSTTPTPAGAWARARTCAASTCPSAWSRCSAPRTSPSRSACSAATPSPPSPRGARWSTRCTARTRGSARAPRSWS